MPKRIVITGGPGTGKTSIIHLLEERGFFCFHEVIRDFTTEAKQFADSERLHSNPLAFVDDPFRFNKHILEARLSHFKAGDELHCDVAFYDRGLPDVLAYMNYFDQSYPDEFLWYCKEHRYDHLLMLPPWRDIYTRDDERLETFEQAIEIHEELLKMYSALKYNSLEVPIGSIEERATFIIDHVIPAT